MVKNKTPIWENNNSPSQFVPSDPALNAALQNTQVDGFAFNQVTLKDMIDNPEVFNNALSDLDKLCLVNQAQQRFIPEIEKAAQNFQNLYNVIRSKK